MKKIVVLILMATLAFGYSCNSSDKYVLIETNFGNIKLKLYKETPEHQKNFIKLVKQGYFDDLLFHRVINNFMIQGGDPESRNAPAGKMLGNGDPGYTLPAEINPLFFHRKGVLAAARMGNDVNPEKRSSGSQFYIVQGRKFSREEVKAMQDKRNAGKAATVFRKLYNQSKDEFTKMQQEGRQQDFNIKMAELQEKAEAEAKLLPDYVYSEKQLEAYATVGGYPSLDNEYTIFGEVTEGLEVVDKIAAVATDQYNRPTEDVKFKIKMTRK